jgi:predicted DNA-binding protein with PD1-like motif
MKAKLLADHGLKTWALVFDAQDEVMDGLTRFASEQSVDAAQLTAVGAFARATLGYFDMDTKEYVKIPVEEQTEVLALVGDITQGEGTRENEPKVHAHVVLGQRDGTTRGGHILEAWVRPTLEVILTESPAHLRRKHDPETGLALIAL